MCVSLCPQREPIYNVQESGHRRKTTEKERNLKKKNPQEIENEEIMVDLAFVCIFKKEPRKDTNECSPLSVCELWGMEKREA